MALALLAAGCGGVGRAPARPPAPPPAVPAPAGEHYRIDPARSEVRILVYRSGALARLGHNHVILVNGLDGELWLPAAPAEPRFELAFPVAALEVDPPSARREEGEEFASEPSAADIAGTKRNMLSAALLDAADYARVRLAGSVAAGAAGPVAHARIEVRDAHAELDVPVAVATAAGELTVRGGFTVVHATLGLTPFSVGLGALKVRDDLAIRFRLVATTAAAP